MRSTCVNCMYWQGQTVTAFAECRRYAPRPGGTAEHVMDGTQYWQGWPSTHGDDGCGEYVNGGYYRDQNYA